MKIFFRCGHRRLHTVNVLCRYYYDCRSIGRNGISRNAALIIGQSIFHTAFRQAIQNIGYSLNGIAATLVNNFARMTAGQSVGANSQSRIARQSTTVQVTRKLHVTTSGRCDTNNMNRFRITINNIFGIFYVVCRKRQGSGHIRFFVNCKDKSQRAVLNFLLYKIKRNCYGNPVVCAETRPVGTQNISFTNQLNRIFLRIKGYSRLSYANHIHMAL